MAQITADMLTRAAQALATAVAPSEHSQLCPIWTRRRRGVTWDRCNCWINRKAAEGARLALGAALDDQAG